MTRAKSHAPFPNAFAIPLPEIKLYTLDQLRMFLVNGKRGDRACYHVGFLTIDKRTPDAEGFRITVMAKAVGKVCRQGQATAFQRKLGVGIYEYLVEKC